MKYNFPIATIIIAVCTVAYSIFVAYDVNGEIFRKIRITELEAYGGITFDHILNLELWRLLVAQLVHSKQLHMLYNVVSLILLGVVVERQLKFIRFFILWFVSGSVGLLLSTLTVESPWNLGTGGSQAIFGVAAYVLLLLLMGSRSKWHIGLLVFTLFPALALDLIYAGYPKLGHMSSFVVGAAISFVFLRSSVRLRGIRPD